MILKTNNHAVTRRALLRLLSAFAIRLLRDFTGIAVQLYIQHRRALHFGIESALARLDDILQFMARPGLLFSELIYVTSVLLLQPWLEARFPTRSLPTEQDELDTEIVRRLIATGRAKPVRVRWRNVWIKWLLENIAFTSIMGIVVAIVAGSRFELFNALPALAHNFYGTWDWLVCVPGYLYLPPGYRLQFRDLAGVAVKLLDASLHHFFLEEHMSKRPFEIASKGAEL